MSWQGAAAKPINWYEPDNKWFSLHDLKKPAATKFNHLTIHWLWETFMPWHFLKTDYNSHYKFPLALSKIWIRSEVQELKCLSMFQEPSHFLVCLKLKKVWKTNAVSLIFVFSESVIALFSMSPFWWTDEATTGRCTYRLSWAKFSLSSLFLCQLHL